jgi:hypothetical protein
MAHSIQLGALSDELITFITGLSEQVRGQAWPLHL